MPSGEVRAFGHQSFLGRQGKNVCAMLVMLDRTSY